LKIEGVSDDFHHSIFFPLNKNYPPYDPVCCDRVADASSAIVLSAFAEMIAAVSPASITATKIKIFIGMFL
jgi:hypothetical protein